MKCETIETMGMCFSNAAMADVANLIAVICMFVIVGTIVYFMFRD